jgi:hypothetical protein
LTRSIQVHHENQIQVMPAARQFGFGLDESRKSNSSSIKSKINQ